MHQAEVFRHAQELQRARSFADVGRVAAVAVRTLTRYHHSWLAIVEPENRDFVRVFEVSSELSELILDKCQRVPIAGDGMLQELLTRNGVVVVEDARIDPRTNKAIVEQLGNRTIVNVPLALGDEVLGCMGMGTFGDEGCLPPTEHELESLSIFGVQLAAAFERVRSFEFRQRVEAEHTRLERRLEALQRIEMMGLLASGVAHDLNNLLTVARMNVELLAEGHDPEAVADVQQALVRATDVCAQLLTLGRGSREHIEPIDLNARLEATLRLVRPAIPVGVKIHHESRPHPKLVGNPVQLDQAFANLILNARDAVGERGLIEVTTDTAHFDEQAGATTGWARRGRYAKVSIIDSGTGIPPELLERIFDPLVTTKKNGTGLGLAVVSRVVAQHNGLIHCESRPGQTRFDLYLPVTE